MIFFKYYAHFAILLLTFLHLCIINCEKCKLTYVSNGHPLVECIDVLTFREVAHELDSTWVNLKIINHINKTFVMDIKDKKGTNNQIVKKFNLKSFSDTENNEHLKNILYLNINDIGHVTISDDGFQPFVRMYHLNLEHASLKTLESSWFPEVNYIKHVYLARNEISVIRRDNMRTLTKLERFDLSFNHIEVIGERPKITYIQLDENLITEIPTGFFKTLPGLLQITFKSNIISTFGHQFKTITTGAKISYLRNATFLGLAYNSLLFVDENMFNGMVALEYLHLFSNEISLIEPNSFAGLVSLQKLFLDSNSLTKISSDMFGSEPLLRLEQLWFGSNFLEVIPDGTFDMTPNLILLALENNRLMSISENVFVPLVRLRRLYLSDNLILKLSSKIMDKAVNELNVFEVARNRLTFLPKPNATSSNLTRIALEGNPWQCSCFLEILNFLSVFDVDYKTGLLLNGKKPLCYVTSAGYCIRNLKVVDEEDLVNKYEVTILKSTK